MVKSELINRLSKRFPHLSVQHVRVAVNTLFELMTNTLSKGERIEVRGFGSFSLRYYYPPTLRNPRTGELLQRTQKTARPYFKPGEQLRHRVNKAYLLAPQQE